MTNITHLWQPGHHALFLASREAIRTSRLLLLETDAILCHAPSRTKTFEATSPAAVSDRQADLDGRPSEADPWPLRVGILKGLSEPGERMLAKKREEVDSWLDGRGHRIREGGVAFACTPKNIFLEGGHHPGGRRVLFSASSLRTKFVLQRKEKQIKVEETAVEIKETYLGDGLYASFDGHQIQLRVPRLTGNHVVFMDAATLIAFERWVKELKDDAAKGSDRR